jgi:uncharacterized protein (DUF433 family)
VDIYGGLDPREAPVYSIREAAHYLRMPASTLRTWVRGRRYPTTDGERDWHPIVDRTTAIHERLSFLDLVQASVLASIRREHKVDVPRIRRAISYVKKELGVERPLVEQNFETDGASLFVKSFGHLINASDEGQLAMEQLLRASLQRIDRDERGIAERFYPWHVAPTEERRIIVIDPKRLFGRPAVANTRIPVDVLVDRNKSGDSEELLAADYEIPLEDVQAAIAWGSRAAAAA